MTTFSQIYSRFYNLFFSHNEHLNSFKLSKNFDAKNEVRII